MRMKIQDDGSSCAERPKTTSRSSKKKPNTRLLSVREDDGILRASINQSSLRSMDTGKLRAEIAGLCRVSGSRSIVLSMRNTESVASCVIGSLAQLSSDLERAGGVLVIYKVPDEVMRVLRKTHLDRLIHTAKDRAGAKKKVRKLSKRGGFFKRHSAA